MVPYHESHEPSHRLSSAAVGFRHVPKERQVVRSSKVQGNSGLKDVPIKALKASIMLRHAGITTCEILKLPIMHCRLS